MAELVAAIGTSHAPPVFLAPEYWRRHSSISDTKNTELLSPRTGIVTAYEDLVKLGSFAKAREAGRLRIEGKEYTVQDGDVLEFRFNV